LCTPRAADVQGRFRNDRTVEGGILVPRQGDGDPKNRPWGSARDVGERSCKGLAGVRRNGSADADRRLCSRLFVASGQAIELGGAATAGCQAEGAVDEPVRDQFPDVSLAGATTRLLSFTDLRQAGVALVPSVAPTFGRRGRLSSYACFA
jgi:hypothetical protein